MFGFSVLAACAPAFVPLPAFPAALRFESPPTLAPAPGGGVLWSASVACPDPPALIGARVAFALDFDLDGAPEAADTLGVSPADCANGLVALRRALRPASPALLRALLADASGAPADSHFALTSGAGSLFSISAYCARPRNGEPEWIEIRNNAASGASLARVKLEGRAIPDALAALEPGGAITAGSDTAELRIWRPGARVVKLSSWPNLRNSGDTIRLALDGGLVLDSVLYPLGGAYPREACVSLESEEAAASAHGYALELPSPARWRPRQESVSIEVRAPAPAPAGAGADRYDLRVYDIDGRPLCVLARGARGPASYALPHAACPALGARRGAVILHLDPRESPGVRRTLAILP